MTDDRDDLMRWLAAAAPARRLTWASPTGGGVLHDTAQLRQLIEAEHSGLTVGFEGVPPGTLRIDLSSEAAGVAAQFTAVGGDATARVIRSGTRRCMDAAVAAEVAWHLLHEARLLPGFSHEPGDAWGS